MKIEVGKKYRTRGGSEVFGPMEPSRGVNPRFTFQAAGDRDPYVCYFGPKGGVLWGGLGRI